MARCSFGRVVLNGVFEPKYPFMTDLEGRLMYMEEDGRQWLLAAFDFSGTFRRAARIFREAISAGTGIPAENVWYHELQTHAAPISFELEGEPCQRLARLCLPEINAMMARAAEAEVAYAILDMGARYSVNREQYVPELGAVTVWAGLEFGDDGLAWCRDPAVMNLGEYRAKLAAFDGPIPFDRPVDSQALLAVFRSSSGDVLGTLARFAAHPDVAVLPESHGILDQYRYHFDWPGYLRETLDGHFGGIALYLNGPCADLAVRKQFIGMTTAEAADREARRIGREIGGALIEGWSGRRPRWEPARLTAIGADSVALPMRGEMPGSLAEARDGADAARSANAELDAAIARGEPPARVKRLIDRSRHMQLLGAMVHEWVGFTDAELERRRAAVEVEAACLNGLVFTALPGECLSATALWLKASTLGERLVPLDQVNGYVGYVTTAGAYDEGGYSCWGGWVAREAEAMLRQKALDLIRRVNA